MVTSGTNYTKKHSRGRGLDSRKDKVVIAESNDEVKEYICGSCNRIIHTRKTNGEIECLHCGDTIIIEGTRKHSKLETPHNRNTETLIADPRTIYGGNNLADSVSIHHEPELKGGFLALSQKGLKIKDYREDKP